MKKNKLIVALLVFIIVLLISLLACLYFVFLRKTPVTQISLKEQNISLYLNDTYDLKYTVLPDDASNKEVTISNSNEKIVKIEDNIITAVGKGNADVCVISKSNSNMKSCINIKVSSKRDEFIKEMDEYEFYVKIDDCTYDLHMGILNVCDNTYTFNDVDDDIEMNYVYHYGQGYIDGYTKGNGFLIKYYYNTSINTLSCVGDSPLYHQTMCNESSNSATKNLFNTMVEFIKSLAGDFTVEERSKFE